jgi:hypothetical protein
VNDAGLANATDGVIEDADAGRAADAMVATYGADLVDPDRLRYYLLDPLTWHTTSFSRPSPR